MSSLFDTYSENDDAEFINAIKYFKPALPIIDSFWEKYAPYADANFPLHFKKDFLARIWELWLGNIFLSQGYTLKERSDSVWPDFIISNKEKQFYVEAICPGNASESSGNQIQDLNPVIFQEIRSDLYEMRIQNAIFEKYQKKYIDELRKKSIPYIIAINACKLPFSSFSFDDFPWIIKALYPLGSEVAILNSAKYSFTTAREQKDANKKSSGYVVDKCIFSSDKYSLISAVIYSTTKISLEEGKITENIYVVKNPYAVNPIDEIFGMDEIVVELLDKKLKYYIKEMKSN